LTELEQLQPVVTPVSRPALLTRLWKALVFVWKFAIGLVCCQSLVFSILLVGWTYRFMQRVALKTWWKRSGSDVSFNEFIGHESWPNWIILLNFRETVGSGTVAPDVRRGIRLVTSAATCFKALFHSLWLNARLGVAGAFNTFVLTLPGCALMLFGWYDGWNNSFNKGYEQFSVGPATSWLGIMLFAAAMLYVPMAQARQAITGEWRAFYQWRLVWRLVRLRWLQSFGIAAAYALLWFPILILRAGAPYLQGKATNMSADQLMALPYELIVKNLNQYFLWCALLILPAFVFVRWLAARNYATSTAIAIKKGIIAAFGLSDFERGALARLNMLEPAPAAPRHILLRVAARAWRFGLRSAAVLAIFLVWVVYIFELYICQFFHYVPGVGWLNHCLVQLPWFHFVPGKF
jgi:hypothetical protein